MSDIKQVGQFTLSDEIPTLQVNIGAESYQIPLMSTMPFSEVEKFRDDKSGDEVRKFFSKHLPAKVMKSLSVHDYIAIVRAWSEASKADMGMTPGESLASPRP